ncbi:tyrosine-type recombinase/integrase [Shewanella olleyana]|uniref:tyrosine-type recombinase/integrase n=1 Tax=Shewanella olleyana TaxID=135626 RepID=UPI00200EA6CD|nr:tyrosine-type recombinase/integrase [Shewanella olleyana]MCL1067213.1 tyrosine-type recombinase/integrase [Shewanella olleyana]
MSEISMLFTDINIENLSYKKSLQTYVDKRCAHLKLIVRPSGKKSYYFRAKHKGKDIKRKLGEANQLTVSMARVLADNILSELKEPLLIFEAESQKDPLKYVTVNDIFQLYNENELCYRKTIAGRAHALEVAYRNHVKPLIGSHYVNELSKKFARSFFKDLEVKGYCAHNKALSGLRAAFNYVIDYEEQLKIQFNPFNRIQKMPSVSRNRYLTHEEAGRLFKALKEVSNQDVADIYRLALFTGARLSNVKQMEWGDLNLSLGTWLIPSTRTKTSQHYEIPLHNMAMDIILNRQKTSYETRFVFPAGPKSKYGYITGGDLVWKQAIKAAGLYHDNPNIRPRPHDLRRTFATWQIQSGADISVVSKALCHTSLKHTMVYAHTNVSQVRDAIDGAFKKLV